MRGQDHKLCKQILIVGIVIFICHSDYSQQNTKARKGIVKSLDSLGVINAVIKDTRKEQDTSGIQNRYFDESQMIGGLVIDHTQSKWGRDFVDLFNKNFNPPEQLNNYTVVIEEKPLPQFGTLILMKVNGNYVYQRFIQPRYQTIKLNAEQASAIALRYLANYQQIQKELQGEDLKGTGIY